MHSAFVISSLLTLLATTASAAPAPSTTNKICVAVAGSHTKEYIAKGSLAKNGLYTITSDAGDALKVTSVRTESGPYYLEAADNTGLKSHGYLAFIVGPGDFNNGSVENGAYAYLGGASIETPPYAPPQVVSNSVPGAVNKGSETTLWQVTGKDVVPAWQNYDAQPESSTLFYDETHKYFAITGNKAEYEEFSKDIKDVTFTLC